MLIMDANHPLGFNKLASAPGTGELSDDQEPTPLAENLRDLVALGTRRARTGEEDGPPPLHNKRSRLASGEPQAHQPTSFEEDSKPPAEDSKLSGVDSPSSLADMVVNVDVQGNQAVSHRRPVAASAAAASAPDDAAGGNQVKDLTGAVIAANSRAMSEQKLGGEGQNLYLQDPGSVYGLSLPMGGVGGGVSFPASGPVAAPAGMQGSPPVSQFQAASGGGGNPMYFQPGSAQASLVPLTQPETAGAQQQYLQGYLSGLQQAKAANTSHQTMVAPHGNFPHGAVGAGSGSFQLMGASGYGGGLSNNNVAAYPFNPAVAAAASGALSPTPIMTTSFHNPASFAAAAPQGFPSLGGGFGNPNVGADPLLGAMINPPAPAQATGGFGVMSGLAGPSTVSLGFVGGVSPVDGFPLALPQVLAQQDDSPNLTNHQILLRHQIEVFEASEDDANTHTRGRNKPIMVGQVGVRCKHCKHLPVLQRQKGSTYFPNSLLGVYQAAQNMNTVHMQCGLCTEMPEEVKRQFVHSMCYSKVHQSGAGRHYWARSSKKLGLVDTEAHGIRFIRNLPQGANVVDIPPS